MIVQNNLTYRGYTTNLKYDSQTIEYCYYGKIEHIQDLVYFSAPSLEEARQYFKEAVDAYIKER